jgi:hypothetical protein
MQFFKALAISLLLGLPLSAVAESDRSAIHSDANEVQPLLPGAGNGICRWRVYYRILPES